jgi:hypothetical protein
MREVRVRYLGVKKFIFKNPAISEPIDLKQGEGTEVWIPHGDYAWFLEFNPTMFELIDERYNTEPRPVTEPPFNDMTIKELVDYAEDYLKTRINIAGVRKPEIIMMVRGLWGEKNKGDESESASGVLGDSVEEADSAGSVSEDESAEAGATDLEDSGETSFLPDEDA